MIKDKLRFLAQYHGIEALWEVLPSARLVGGCVRDLLLGYEIHDIDFAVPLAPENVMALLEARKIRVFPTGLDHGTVTAVIEGHHYEITTLRRDVTTDGRHAEVAWSDDWKEDAQRRDFTINALSLDKDGNLYDYFSGLEDLEKKILRFVGVAERRIEEDALRILRFFRFSARYSDWGGESPLEAQAYKAIREKKHLIQTLSAERIASEIFKILAGPHLCQMLSFMDEMGVLAEIFPTYSVSHLETLLHLGHKIEKNASQEEGKEKREELVENGVLLRFYALSSQAAMGKKLKLSNLMNAHLKALEASLPYMSDEVSDEALRRLCVCYRRPLLWDKSWLAQTAEYASLQAEDKEKKKEIVEKWSLLRQRLIMMEQPYFPLQGKDLLALGLPPGPQIGIWLKRVKEWWMREGCSADHERCVAWFKASLEMQEKINKAQ